MLVQLEKNAVSNKKKKKESIEQFFLFDTTKNPPPEKDALKEEIKNIDLNTTSPIEAHQFLLSLQEKVKTDEL